MTLTPYLPSEDVRPGQVLGRYELLVPIAAGGMAQVWGARLRGARQFQKIVAVKTMLPKLSDDPQFEQMFLDEASLASQIRHPNVVETLDLGEEDGVLYLVMEWIDGVPLNQLMKAAKDGGGVPPAIAARIALHACAGLHAAHELHDEKGSPVGLVHRDVSPQNLLVTYDGVTKVVDFGVAKATALGGGATVTGQVKGKISYMAPEQVKGEGLDRRADVFALGIVLYALTTGKHPFRRESEAATMYAICSPEKAVAPSRVVADYPAELEPIVMKALEKDRDLRYASCDEMLRALDALPSHLRVGSDADVATFVRDLFGDKRFEQKRRIEKAIARVDSASSPENTPPSGSWRSSSALTLGAPRPTSPSLAGEVSGISSNIREQTTRNRIIGALGLLVLALSGVVLFQATRSGSSISAAGPVRDIEAPSVPLPEATTAAAVALDAAGQPEEATGQAVAAAEPTAAEPTAEPNAADKPTLAPAVRGSGGSPTPHKAQVPAKANPSAKKKSEAWKYEAGF